ncbi:hypothetical protein ACI8AA_06010 [Geodermatophilus sp. SYSU D01180]
MTRVGALLVALACAGCTSSAGTPGAVAGRAALPPCPVQDLGQGERVAADALACPAAGAADGAELVVTRPTTEGDPVTRWYRARPGVPGLEVIVDGSRDRFGTGDWLRLDCPAATSPEDLGDCGETVLGRGQPARVIVDS